MVVILVLMSFHRFLKFSITWLWEFIIFLTVPTQIYSFPDILQLPRLGEWLHYSVFPHLFILFTSPDICYSLHLWWGGGGVGDAFLDIGL